jgi:hypothetical protein
MAIGDLKNILHKIRVKLYPNYLPNADGPYIARTDNEATLSLEDVCTTSKTRGGFTGKFEDYVFYVRQFFDEMTYQLLDGYAVSTEYFSLHPNVGGVFNNDKEAYDPAKHPVTFRFRTLRKLRKLAENIDVEIEGIADTQGYIMEVTDVNTGAVNESLTAGGQYIITGYKIKIAGDDAGVYLQPVSGASSGARILISEHLAENTPSKLIGIIPADLPGGIYKVVIQTQFTGSGNMSKECRIIESGFTLAV